MINNIVINNHFKQVVKESENNKNLLSCPYLIYSLFSWENFKH